MSDYPIFGYDNIFGTGIVTSSGDASGFPYTYLYDWKMFTYWKASASGDAWVKSSHTDVKTCNYFAVYGHTLFENGATVSVEYSHNDSTWTVAATKAPTSADAIMVTFNAVSAKYWRIKVSSPGAASLIACASIGLLLQAERGARENFTPPETAFDDTIMNSQSDNGIFLGRSIIQSGIKCSMSFEYVTPQWIRSHWEPFMRHARVKPFFLLWCRSEYPNVACFVWSAGQLQPPAYMHPRFMRCGISMEGRIV